MRRSVHICPKAVDLKSESQGAAAAREFFVADGGTGSVGSVDSSAGRVSYRIHLLTCTMHLLPCKGSQNKGSARVRVCSSGAGRKVLPVTSKVLRGCRMIPGLVVREVVVFKCWVEDRRAPAACVR